MAATSNKNDATAQVLAAVADIGKRVAKTEDLVEGLLKSVRVPASRAGLSPQEFIAKMTNGGQTPMVIGDDGAMMPVPTRLNRARKGIGIGPLCRALAKRARADLSFITQEECEKVFREHPDLVEKAALAESSGTTGGYTVPPQFANQLLQLSIEDTIIKPRASIFPMTSLTLSIPALDMTSTGAAGQSPYLGGVSASWTSEAKERQETEPQFKQIELTAWEISFFTVASNNLLADSAIALDSLLTQLFPAAIAWYTEYAYLRGNGVGKPLGIVPAGCTVQVTRGTGGHFTFADVGAMMSRLFFRSDRSSLVWMMHQSVIADLFAMTVGATGHPAFIPFSAGVQEKVPGWEGMQQFGALAGIPVFVTEKLPVLGTSGDVMLCDLSKYLIGDRAEIQVEVSPHVKFVNNQMVWRVIARGDGRPWLDSAITQADGNASYTVSPFIKLS